MFHAQNCVLLSFQSFLRARQRCINEILFIQGPFHKIQELLGKIQGLFTDLSKFLHFQGFFKGLMLFQGLSRPMRTMGSPWMGNQIQIPRVVIICFFSFFFPSFFQGDIKDCRTAILA